MTIDTRNNNVKFNNSKLRLNITSFHNNEFSIKKDTVKILSNGEFSYHEKKIHERIIIAYQKLITILEGP